MKIKPGNKVKVTNFDWAVTLTDGELERVDPKFFYAPATVLAVNGSFPSCYSDKNTVNDMINNVMLIDANDNILFTQDQFLELDKTEVELTLELVGTLWAHNGRKLMFCRTGAKKFCFICMDSKDLGNRYLEPKATFSEATKDLDFSRIRTEVGSAWLSAVRK